MNLDYWKKQEKKPLFEDVAWNRPEQKSLGGKFGIIGGNSNGFSAISFGLKVAEEFGVGEAKALLPDSLRRLLPAAANISFAGSNNSGGFAKGATEDMLALSSWADTVLILGDVAKNAETAVAIGQFLRQNDKPVVVTRDAVDLMIPSMHEIIDRDNLTLILTFAQLQKLFRTIYYPKVLTFSMPLLQAVEALHKFTLSYPIAVATFYDGNYLCAHNGVVVSEDISNTKYSPMSLWSGEIAVKSSIYQIWSPKKPLEAVATAVL